MRRACFLLWVSCGIICIPLNTYAQEENDLKVAKSSEVFLEEYSDEFQENFFEGLKQKSIQNYDRAIIYLLECRRLQPDNNAVTHELAKLYFLDKNYPESLSYGIESISEAPHNYWYLYTLVTSLNAQGNTIGTIENDIPIENKVLKENLAKIYYGQGRFEAALTLLKSLDPSKSVSLLEQNINTVLAQKKTNTTSVSYTATSNSRVTNDLESYKSRIRGLFMMPAGNSLLLQVSEEALENYPAQPYFYYANGYALNRNKKYRNAIEVLETALDYMLSDISLANKIYTELSTAYNAISNPSKANMYLRKVKPGF